MLAWASVIFNSSPKRRTCSNSRMLCYSHFAYYLNNFGVCSKIVITNWNKTPALELNDLIREQIILFGSPYGIVWKWGKKTAFSYACCFSRFNLPFFYMHFFAIFTFFGWWTFNAYNYNDTLFVLKQNFFTWENFITIGW